MNNHQVSKELYEVISLPYGRFWLRRDSILHLYQEIRQDQRKWSGWCIPVKSTDFGGSLPIVLPSYRQPTDLPQSTDFYRFFRGSTEF